jgi:hypothetical protein
MMLGDEVEIAIDIEATEKAAEQPAGKKKK